MSEYTRDLCRWLNGGLSPYHTVRQAAEFLKTQGFTQLSLGDKFSVSAGGRYYIENGTFLAAVTVGSEAKRFRVAASHTDWPCMRVKPDPELLAGGCCKLSVEPYGGAILSSWLDRPLTLAGVVMVRGETAMRPEARLIAWDEPLMTIPSLAIHMNREVNKGVPVKPNVDMLPICRALEDGIAAKGELLARIAEKLQVETADILSFELCVTCSETAQELGFEKDFLSSPRLDNLTSVHATLDGLVRADGKDICIAALFDNEEIGSNTRRGGDSATLPVVMEKLSIALGMSREEFLNACLNGLLLSCDAAHAAHPNHMEFADGVRAPMLNRGVALKRSPRYSSEAETCAVVTALCRAHNIPLQTYMNRADLPGGSTVGSMASSLLAMPAVDVGVPILAMHSARELMGAKDQEAFCKLCEAFFHD